MSVPTKPVSGTLTAVSPSPVGVQPVGSAVQIQPVQVEQQALVIISGTFTGLQVAMEGQDPQGLAPYYGCRAIPQATGNPVWGGTPIQVPDNPQGTNPAYAILVGIEAAGTFRARCVALGSGAPNVAMLVGSFFGVPPVPTSQGIGIAQQNRLLQVMRSIERMLALQTGQFVAVGTDDGAGNTLVQNPTLGDGIG